MSRIAAVVVTYNRINELQKNLDMLFLQTKQLDKIFVIDNCSSDNTVETIKEMSQKHKEICLIELQENIGGAGGFYCGTKTAFKQGFDYIVLMDDDGRPYDANTINVLFNTAEKSSNRCIMINSLVFDGQERLSFGLSKKIQTVTAANNAAIDGIIHNSINPFNGTLISRELISKIGYPNKDFFIKGDETDYTNRAKKNFAFVATLIDSLYYHPSLVRSDFRFFLLKFSNNLEAPWKEYYRARNYTFMYGKKNHKKIIYRIIKSFLLHDADYKHRNKMIKRGYLDGLNKKMGKIVNPGDLA